MANIKSQIKRIKTNEKARLRNRFVKQSLKTYVKKVRKAIKENNKELAQTAYKEAARQLDKAVSKGVIHKKQAANRKSALQTAINEME